MNSTPRVVHSHRTTPKTRFFLLMALESCLPSWTLFENPLTPPCNVFFQLERLHAVVEWICTSCQIIRGTIYHVTAPPAYIPGTILLYARTYIPVVYNMDCYLTSTVLIRHFMIKVARSQRKRGALTIITVSDNSGGPLFSII